MVNLMLSVPGKFYRDAITGALEQTGNFRVWSPEEGGISTNQERGRPQGRGLGEVASKGLGEAIASGHEGGFGGVPESGGLSRGAPDVLSGRECEEPEIALLGVSVQQGFTLGERKKVIRKLREKKPECRIVLFVDEVVSPEQTEGVKNLKQARLIDGFLYASGTMEYLVATLESM